MNKGTVLDAPEPEVVEGTEPPDAERSKRRGHLWLAFSFIACPCHLPVTMALFAVVFGGTAFGALISRNTIAVGVTFGIIYIAGIAVAFRHLRAAAKGAACSTDGCELPVA